MYEPQFLVGDAREVLATLPAESVQCVVTSPPHRRVSTWGAMPFQRVSPIGCRSGDSKRKTSSESRGSSPFLLRADGWYLRQDIIWHKPNPMPESVKDRCTKAHEYLFLLSKSERYTFDQQAIGSLVTESTIRRSMQEIGSQAGSARANGGSRPERPMKTVLRDNYRRSCFDSKRTAEHQPQRMGRGERIRRTWVNARSVWTLATGRSRSINFAVFPDELPRRCILAGSRPGDMVLDPFVGSGTTCRVAEALGRRSIGIDCNPEQIQEARDLLERARHGMRLFGSPAGTDLPLLWGEE